MPLCTGARTATLLARLPFIPAADAYVCEVRMLGNPMQVAAQQVAGCVCDFLSPSAAVLWFTSLERSRCSMPIPTGPFHAGRWPYFLPCRHC